MTVTDRSPSSTGPQRGSALTLSRQFRRPRGPLGWLAGQLMARKNVPMMAKATEKTTKAVKMMIPTLRSRGCRDGLHPDRANENQGAESTLSFLMALLEMRKLEEADITDSKS